MTTAPTRSNVRSSSAALPPQTMQKSPHGGTARGARSVNSPLSQISGRWRLILASPKWTEQMRSPSFTWKPRSR